MLNIAGHLAKGDGIVQSIMKIVGEIDQAVGRKLLMVD